MFIKMFCVHLCELYRLLDAYCTLNDVVSVVHLYVSVVYLLLLLFCYLYS